MNIKEELHIIINDCKKGNRKAQELLYRNYYRAMIMLCLRYTKNDTDAVEVLNHAFFKVFKNIEQYRENEAGIYTWIRKIVINTCLDFIKSKQRRQQYDELSEAVEVDIPPEVIHTIKAKELLQLIRKLPPATQGVFNLYVMEGYNHREVAELMGISEGTSKWHLSEARKMLQKMIKVEENFFLNNEPYKNNT